MKRSLIYLLVAIVAAAWLGTLVARDPGYVLVSWDGATLQTGLWVMLGLLATAGLMLWLLFKLIRFLLNSTGYWRAWRVERRKTRSFDQTFRGLTCYQEGDYERAERLLVGGVKQSERPAINYLYAARAADAQGKSEVREHYLRLALESDPGAKKAIAIAGAEMAVANGQTKRALVLLKDLDNEGAVLRLKSTAMLTEKDWQGLFDLMPQLRKTVGTDQELFDLQKRIALERFMVPGTTDDALSIIYKKLPERVREDQDVVTRYCLGLKQEAEAEVAIRTTLKRVWIPELVERYGALGRETLARRQKTAEGWLAQHGDDAALHFCLGLLYEAGGDKDKAKAAFQKSVDLKGSARASRSLGRLLAFDGDYKKSHEHLNHALKVVTGEP